MSSTAGGPPLKEPVPFLKKTKLVLVRTLFRFFTFHNVIWDNEPNLPGSKIESEIIKQSKDPKPANQWAAPHYQPAPAPAEEAKQ